MPPIDLELGDCPPLRPVHSCGRLGMTKQNLGEEPLSEQLEELGFVSQVEQNHLDTLQDLLVHLEVVELVQEYELVADVQLGVERKMLVALAF